MAPLRSRSPLGPDFDPTLWLLDPPQPSANLQIAALVDLAHAEICAGHFAEAAAIGRLARARAPREEAPKRLLAMAGPALRLKDERKPKARFHLALAEAYRILGEPRAAEAEYRLALALDQELTPASVGLSRLVLPGPDYVEWLRRFHRALAPETYVEIGVGTGKSLALARPPTRAIAVDPDPRVTSRLLTDSHIFPETSDVFFRLGRLKGLLNGQPLGLGFIDGLHLFEQALRDFMNLEAYCSPRSLLLFHDTLPLDELSQRREPSSGFHCGDVWKAVLCLRHYRPDLEVFTMATPLVGADGRRRARPLFPRPFGTL